MSEIRTSLENNFQVFIVTNREDHQRLTMRIYLGNSINFDSRQRLLAITEEFLDFNVRGLNSIVSANVISEKMMILDKNGSIIP